MRRPTLTARSGSTIGSIQLKFLSCGEPVLRVGWRAQALSRSLDGETIRSATVVRNGGHWFISVLVDDGARTPAQHSAPGTAVGVDRGVATAIATSAGELIDRAFTTAGERRRVVALQRRLSRCATRSANRDKARAELATLRARERRRRLDFCAQTAHQLATVNAVVVVEDLKTRNMTRSAKGTLQANTSPAVSSTPSCSPSAYSNQPTAV